AAASAAPAKDEVSARPIRIYFPALFINPPRKIVCSGQRDREKAKPMPVASPLGSCHVFMSRLVSELLSALCRKMSDSSARGSAARFAARQNAPHLLGGPTARGLEDGG